LQSFSFRTGIDLLLFVVAALAGSRSAPVSCAPW
jgi:hypothetical protein